MVRRGFLLWVSTALALTACPPPKITLPAGASCSKTVTAGPGVASVTEALAKAEKGTCVVLAPGKYVASLSVPPGVTLAAEVGTTADVVGDSTTAPAIFLGAGATLSGVHVTSAPGVGVAANKGGVHLVDVVVHGAQSLGVVMWCEDDCLTADPDELRDVELSGNAVGLLVQGARVNVVGGSVTGSQSSMLASGYGIVASGGGDLQMSGTRIEDNQELGLLIDGAKDTNAALQDVKVQNNRGRGVWAQGLSGTMGAPKLQLTTCTVEGNRLVGVGARNSKGIRVQGGRIAATTTGEAVSTTPGVLVTVGDGLGLFETTGDVLVDAVTLERNGRSQVLVDQGAAGLTVQSSTVTAATGQLGIVVQRTTATVTAPMITTPLPGQELGISAPTEAVPSR